MDQAIISIAEMYDGYGTALFILITTVIAGILAGIIGFEREIRGQSAGLRTHVLLAVGSSLLMSISVYAIQYVSGGSISFDGARIAAGVVSGIGFLCAGCIIRTGSSIRGLTTSATLWICGGIGLAVGCGFVLEAIIVTGVVLIFLLGLVYLERIIDKKCPFVTITADEDVPILSIIHKKADEFNLVIKSIDSEVNTDENDDSKKTVILNVRFAYNSSGLAIYEMVEALSLTEKVYQVTSANIRKSIYKKKDEDKES